MVDGGVAGDGRGRRCCGCSCWDRRCWARPGSPRAAGSGHAGGRGGRERRTGGGGVARRAGRPGPASDRRAGHLRRRRLPGRGGLPEGLRRARGGQAGGGRSGHRVPDRLGLQADRLDDRVRRDRGRQGRLGRPGDRARPGVPPGGRDGDAGGDAARPVLPPQRAAGVRRRPAGGHRLRPGGDPVPAALPVPGESLPGGVQLHQLRADRGGRGRRPHDGDVLGGSGRRAPLRPAGHDPHQLALLGLHRRAEPGVRPRRAARGALEVATSARREQSPAGGVSSSARDLAQWVRLQLANGAYGGRSSSTPPPWRRRTARRWSATGRRTRSSTARASTDWAGT